MSPLAVTYQVPIDPHVESRVYPFENQENLALLPVNR
jgi:hypothetical protein